MKFTSKEAKNFRCPKIPQLPYSPEHSVCVGKKCALWKPDKSVREVEITPKALKVIVIEKSFLGIKHKSKEYDTDDIDYYQALLDKKYGEGKTVFNKIISRYGNVVIYTVPEEFVMGQCGLIHKNKE